MRKLRLQMQITIDGFVARPDGSQDWMISISDNEIIDKAIDIDEDSGMIIMGRKMSRDFLEHWEKTAAENDPKNPELELAKRMVKAEKVIFSKTLKSTNGKNARVENGDLKTEVNKLKQQPGKDILVYGGASFVSNLIEEGLVDEYIFFVNPAAIGNGMSIFKGDQKLKLLNSTSYASGVVMNRYICSA